MSLPYHKSLVELTPFYLASINHEETSVDSYLAKKVDQKCYKAAAYLCYGSPLKRSIFWLYLNGSNVYSINRMGIFFVAK